LSTDASVAKCEDKDSAIRSWSVVENLRVERLDRPNNDGEGQPTVQFLVSAADDARAISCGEYHSHNCCQGSVFVRDNLNSLPLHDNLPSFSI
jgi:hypothetical protein